MRRMLTLTVAVALFTVLVAGGCSGNDGPAKPSVFATPAQQLVDDLGAFKYANVRVHFDADVAAHLSNADLGNNWRKFEELLGNYKGRGAAKTTKVDKAKGITFVSVPTQMENGKGEVRIAYHTTAATIAGLYFAKSGS